MDLGLQGRVALVTGASSGLGRAIAGSLAAEGARVAMSSRSQERIDAAAKAVGGTAFTFNATDPDGAGGLVDQVEGELGPVEILVTNTGGPPVSDDALALSTEQWDTAYRSLVLTPLALAARVLPGMQQRGWGRILNSSSSVVREPMANLVLSNSHRSAALAAFKTLSRQVAGQGITVNTLLPGRIATERLIQVYGSEEAVQRMVRQEIPTGRLGTVEEYAAAAVFLCSAPASYITGVALLVDGGMTRSA
jgi:3-oxoacyl-[acyl-carrier protein] reductase